MAIYKLGEICNIKRGSSPRPINKWLRDKGLMWAKISDISKFSIMQTKQFIAKEWITKGLIGQKNDLFITNSATPGIPFLQLSNNPIAYHDGFVSIKPNKNLVSNKYLLYRLILDKSKLIKLGNGAIFVNLSCKIIGDWKVNIPSLKTQKQIIDIIEPIEKLIDLIKKIIWKVEIIKRKIYTYSIFKIEKLENIAFAKSGKQPPLNYHINNEKEGYTRFIQNRDYSNYKIKSYIPSNFKGVKVTKKDILIDKYGEPGKTRYGINGFINVAMLKLIPFENKNKESIRNHFENEEILKWLKRASQASTRPSLNWNFLKTLTIGLSSSNDLLSWLLSIELKFKKTNLILIQLKDLLVKILII